MTSTKPYACPICGGKGKVDRSFYENPSTDASPMTCRSCQGTGIVWGVEA